MKCLLRFQDSGDLVCSCLDYVLPASAKLVAGKGCEKRSPVFPFFSPAHLAYLRGRESGGGGGKEWGLISLSFHLSSSHPAIVGIIWICRYGGEEEGRSEGRSHSTWDEDEGMKK